MRFYLYLCNLKNKALEVKSTIQIQIIQMFSIDSSRTARTHTVRENKIKCIHLYLYYIFLCKTLGIFRIKHYLCNRKRKNTAMIGTRSITDMYMVVLSSLSNNDKLDLISKLSSSMRDGADKKRMRPNLRTCFKGDWSSIDADSLRDHEYHGRTVESW